MMAIVYALLLVAFAVCAYIFATTPFYGICKKCCPNMIFHIGEPIFTQEK